MHIFKDRKINNPENNLNFFVFNRLNFIIKITHALFGANIN